MKIRDVTAQSSALWKRKTLIADLEYTVGVKGVLRTWLGLRSGLALGWRMLSRIGTRVDIHCRVGLGRYRVGLGLREECSAR